MEKQPEKITEKEQNKTTTENQNEKEEKEEVKLAVVVEETKEEKAKENKVKVEIMALGTGKGATAIYKGECSSSLLLLLNNEPKLLIDIGLGVTLQYQTLFPLLLLPPIFITHNHSDHSGELPVVVVTENGKRKLIGEKPIEIYAQKIVKEILLKFRMQEIYSAGENVVGDFCFRNVPELDYLNLDDHIFDDDQNFEFEFDDQFDEFGDGFEDDQVDVRDINGNVILIGKKRNDQENGKLINDHVNKIQKLSEENLINNIDHNLNNNNNNSNNNNINNNNNNNNNNGDNNLNNNFINLNNNNNNEEKNNFNEENNFNNNKKNINKIKIKRKKVVEGEERMSVCCVRAKHSEICFGLLFFWENQNLFAYSADTAFSSKYYKILAKFPIVILDGRRHCTKSSILEHASFEQIENSLKFELKNVKNLKIIGYGSHNNEDDLPTPPLSPHPRPTYLFN